MDFVQSIYSAANLSGNVVQGNFTLEQLESLDSGAAYYANTKYGYQKYKEFNLDEAGAELFFDLEQNTINLLEENENSFLLNRSYTLDNQNITFVKNKEDKIKLSDSEQLYTLNLGTESDELLTGNTGHVIIAGYAGNDALAQYSHTNQSYNELSKLVGGEGNDHFGVFGKSIVEDIERNDRVYVNNLEVTGGVKQAVWDEQVAWNPFSGHGFRLYGNSENEDGATLAVKWLWDNDNIAFVENYTHRYLEASLHAANDNQYIYAELTLIKVA